MGYVARTLVHDWKLPYNAAIMVDEMIRGGKEYKP